jgi:hypothetical protein
MRAELLAPDDPRWMAFLAGTPHDFYHLPEYVKLCARQDGGEPVAFWAEADGFACLAPLVLRPLPAGLEADPGWRDAGAPYGYPSPLLRPAAPGPVPAASEAALAAFLGAFRELGTARGIVSAFLRLHPLLPLPEAPFRAFGTLVAHGSTVYLDLDQSPAELDRQTRVNHLADARKLERLGFRVLVDAWERLDDFIRVYDETMRLRAADPGYRFDRDYYLELRRCLGDRLHLGLVQAPDGAVAAAGLFTRVDGLVQFHLSGTGDAHRRAGPAKLMLIHMRDWAQAAGAHRLHLGGGVGCREDSLAFFKQGFSKLRARFQTFRMVLDPDRYGHLARLARLAPEAQRANADPGEPGAFFPVYRRPAPPMERS